MKTKLLTFALLLVGVLVRAQIVSVSILDDCNKNGQAQYYKDGHWYVDLGLSIQWATMNVGADTPKDYGDYYGW